MEPQLGDVLPGDPGSPVQQQLAVGLGAQAGEGAGRLAPYAEVWEKVADAVREAEALNLDKRPLVLSIFADLAAAVRAARS